MPLKCQFPYETKTIAGKIMLDITEQKLVKVTVNHKKTTKQPLQYNITGREIYKYV